MLSFKGTEIVKVIFITSLPGRLANRLISLYDFQALAHSYGYITVPCVFGWTTGFVGLRKHIFSRYVLLRILVPFLKHIEIPAGINENEAESLILDVLKSGESAAIGLNDWLPLSLRGHELPNPEKARRYFTPVKKYLKAAKKVCDSARIPEKKLVGVHIRHGDFAHHDGGRWFLSLETVIANMQHLSKIAGDCQFLVCSDAEFKAADFPNLDVIFGPNHPVSDIAALAFCDLILKPAYSSYSLWAAWWGQKPCIAMQATPTFQMSDFCVPVLDPFADSR